MIVDRGPVVRAATVPGWWMWGLTAWVAYLIVHLPLTWIGYDQFRELWGAASIVSGTAIPVTGGGASIVGHASPLTSYLYALCLWIWRDEAAPTMAATLLAILTVLWLSWRHRDTWLPLLAWVALSSPMRLIDLRGGVDTIWQWGVFTLLIGLEGTMRPGLARHPLVAFARGVAAGLLPHIHISGLFQSAAIAWYGAFVGGARWRTRLWLCAGMALPLLYFLLPLVPVDRPLPTPTPLGTSLGSAVEQAANIFRATALADAFFWREFDVGNVVPWLQRGAVLLAWGALIAGLARRSQHLGLVALALAYLGFLAIKRDYILQVHFVTLISLLLYGGRQIPLSARHRHVVVVLAAAAVALQSVPAVAVQRQAARLGWYTLPTGNYTLGKSFWRQGPPYLLARLPTVGLRREMLSGPLPRRRLAGVPPQHRRAFVTAGMATGFLQLNDLFVAPAQPDVPPALAPTLRFETFANYSALTSGIAAEAYESGLTAPGWNAMCERFTAIAKPAQPYPNFFICIQAMADAHLFDGALAGLPLDVWDGAP